MQAGKTLVGLTSIAAMAVLALLFGQGTALAAPQGPWVPPQSDLSTPDVNSVQPRIAVGSDGTATAVWTRLTVGAPFGSAGRHPSFGRQFRGSG